MVPLENNEVFHLVRGVQNKIICITLYYKYRNYHVETLIQHQEIGPYLGRLNFD